MMKSAENRPRGEVAELREWLVPPVLFPRFLFLMIVGYAIRACADS
jgi:hypothetical protein